MAMINKYEAERYITKIFREYISALKKTRQYNKELDSKTNILFKDISRFSRLEPEEAYQEYMKLLDANIELIFIDNFAICTDYIKNLLTVAKQQDLLARVSMEYIVKLLLLVELQRTNKEREITALKGLLTMVQEIIDLGEREITIKRIKDGIAASSKRSGRPKGTLDKMTPELHTAIEEYLKDRTIKQVDLIQKFGLSRATMIKYIKAVKEETL